MVNSQRTIDATDATDATDAGILPALASGPRATVVALAEQLGLPRDTV